MANTMKRSLKILTLESMISNKMLRVTPDSNGNNKISIKHSSKIIKHGTVQTKYKNKEK